MPVQHKYCLLYFDAMGRAEPIRLLFALKGVDYEDKRIARDAWPDFKPKTPFGQMPCLEVEGQVLGQTLSILRYLAKQHGLLAATDLENAKVDSLADGVHDMFGNEALRAWFREQDPEKKKEKAVTAGTEAITPFLKLYTKFLTEAAGEYFVGKTMTWVDLLVFSAIDFWQTKFPELFAIADYAPLLAFHKRIRAIPQIKKWIAERPVTPF